MHVVSSLGRCLFAYNLVRLPRRNSKR
jgi:hypothetical protein